MTKIYQAVFRRGRKLSSRHFLKTSLLIISTLALATVTLAFIPQTSAATSWGSQGRVGYPGASQYWRPGMAARPTDGTVFFAGEPGAADSLYLTTSANPAANTNIDDGGSNGNKRAYLDFASSGAGYFVWRNVPPNAGYRAYFRKMNADGSFASGIDLGITYVYAGGSAELDVPDVAVSKLTGRVYVVGQIKSSPGRLGLVEVDANTGAVLNVYDNLPATSGGAIYPRICIDNSQGRDDIHVVGWFGYNLYGVDRINGLWAGSAALTGLTVYDYNLGQQVGIACGNDGYAYAAYDSINADWSGYSTGLVRYTPGAGWAPVNRNPSNQFGAYDIYGLGYSANWICGIPGVNGSSVAVTPDNEVWVASGISCGGFNGVVVASFSNRGATLDTFDHPVSVTDNGTNQLVELEYATKTSKLYTVGTFKEPGNRQTLFNSTPIVTSPTNLAATAASFKQLNLSWSYTYPGNMNYTQVERWNGSAWVMIAQLPSSQTYYSDSAGLLPGTTYKYRVRGYNGTTGTDYSNEASSTTIAAAYLTFDVPPSKIEPGYVFGVMPKVSVRDPYGNVVTNYTGSVTLGISSGPSSGTLSGTTTVATSSGIADFSSSNLKLSHVGTYLIGASAPNIPSGTLTGSFKTVATANLVITALNPSRLANETFPATVTVQRNDGTPVNNYSGPISLTIKAGSGTTGALLNSGTSVAGTVSGGTASFSSLAIDRYGGSYQLTVVSTNGDPLFAGYSNAFNIIANPSFAATVTNPSNPQANQSFSVTVTVKDTSGTNTLTTYNGQVTLTKASGSGSLTGPTSAIASNGIATFNNLAFTTAGNYTLQASLPLGNSATSSSISVSAGPSCDGYLVNTLSLTGDDFSGACNTITLQGAIIRAQSQANQIIRFESTVASGTIDWSGNGNLTIPTNTGLFGGCSASGPTLTINVSSSVSFNIGPSSNIWGIKIVGPTNGLRVPIPNSQDGNNINCFKVGP
jgi:hypothetical protein